MGRKRRNQDTTQVVNAKHNDGAADNQLNASQSLEESVPKIVNEIPYEDRPIPEAYFPPEDEVQEYMPEPVIQKTPIPNSNVNQNVGNLSNSETKTEYTKRKISDSDFESLYFSHKPTEIKGSDVDASVAAIDTLVAINDSTSVDSLAIDSVAFVPVGQPKPKREIISVDGKETPSTINNMWWFTPAILVIFIAYVIIIRDRKKAIFSELKSFVKPNTDGSIFGFQWLQNSKYKFFLSVLGMITLSLYLFLSNSMIPSASWIFFLAVAVFVVGKRTMLALLEYIYFEGADVASMSGAFMVMIRQTGLLLMPSVLGLSFAPENYRSFFIYLGLFVIGSAILAFNLKLIVNFLRGITSIFYLILYLCTLEVIPVAIFFVLGLLPRM